MSAKANPSAPPAGNISPHALEFAAIQPAAGPGMSASNTLSPLSLSDLDVRVAATRALLSASAAGGFIIQVMTSDGEGREPLERVLHDPRLAKYLDQLYIAPTRINGAQRWSVLFGGYQNYAEARQALKDIPTGIEGAWTLSALDQRG